MRKYIDILNESLIKEETLSEDILPSSESLLRKIVQVWDDTKGHAMAEIREDELFEVVEEIRAFLGQTDSNTKSRDYQRGLSNARKGFAYDPPHGSARSDYDRGWEQGRAERHP